MTIYILKEIFLEIIKSEGGSGTNVVPEKICITGEVRSNSMEKVEKNISMISERFNNEALKLNGQIEFEWRWDFKPFKILSRSKIIKDVRNAISCAGLNPQPSMSKGGSDANSFNENGLQSIKLGIGTKNPHSNDEFILLEDLQKSFNIAFELVRKK